MSQKLATKQARTRAVKTKAGDISAAAVHKATGKTWPEWLALLDAAGARKMSHKEIVAILAENGVGPWWQQMVTVGYERQRGLRVKHETAKGFQIGRGKTLAVSAARVYAAFADRHLRARWLADPDFEIRKATLNTRLLITWVDGKSSVEVNVLSKGKEKTQVTVQHNKLTSARAAERMKKYWAAQLERLAETLLS